MTNEQILKKAIKKAVKNGWWGKAGKAFLEGFETGVKKWAFNGRYYSLIFSHDFAKAFFGEEEIITGYYRGDFPPQEGTQYQHVGCYILKWNERPERPTAGFVEVKLPAWQYHLQQMVLAEDSLQYLKRFL